MTPVSLGKLLHSLFPVHSPPWELLVWCPCLWSCCWCRCPSSATALLSLRVVPVTDRGGRGETPMMGRGVISAIQ